MGTNSLKVKIFFFFAGVYAAYAIEAELTTAPVRCLAPIGDTKGFQVLFYLIFPMEWRSSFSYASTGVYFIEYFQSWRIIIQLEILT